MSTTFVNKNVVNQNIYTFDGFWHNPDNDADVPIHYYISEDMGVEKVNDQFQAEKMGMTIVVGGDYPFMIGDTITLDDKNELQITKIIPRKSVVNRQFRDLVKPQVKDIILKLE